MGAIPPELIKSIGLLIIDELAPPSIRSYVRWGTVGYLVYQMYLYSQGKINDGSMFGSPLSGYKVKIDSNLAVNMIAPQLGSRAKDTAARLLDVIQDRMNARNGRHA